MRVVTPFPHIAVNLETRTIEIEAAACLDVGWLEQVMCAPGTREHESLLVTQARASHVHAALLLAQFEPGSPGAWRWEDEQVHLTPPRGDTVEVSVRYERSLPPFVTRWTGRAAITIDEPIGNWVRDHLGRHAFPDDPWVFGGSQLAENPERLGGGEYYVADYSGSIIGLVTFGDEVIGWSNVMADQEAVHPPEWEVNSDRVPRPGKAVTVVLQPSKDASQGIGGHVSDRADEVPPPGSRDTPRDRRR